MVFSQIKKGVKVVDRWYSYKKNPWNIRGYGVVEKVSRKNKTAQIRFQSGGLITYDAEHIEHFVKSYARGMERKYRNGQVIPK